MSQPRSRRAAPLAGAIIAASLVVAACGSVHPGSSAANGSGATSPSACATPAAKVQASSPLTVSEADNNKSLCIHRGDGVMVYLHGTPAHMWSGIESNSAVLARRANGRLMLALGVTGAYFVAVHSGTAVLTSSRTACGPSVQPTGPTTSGPHCAGGKSVFRVTLVISG